MFLTDEDVTRCINYSLRPRIVGEKYIHYFISCDLGLVRDRTAVAIMHKDEESGKVVLDNLRVWQGTHEDPVLIADIEEFILSCAQNFDVRTVVVDPYQMKGTIERLNKMSGIEIEEFTFTNLSGGKNDAPADLSNIRTGPALKMIYFQATEKNSEIGELISETRYWNGACWKAYDPLNPDCIDASKYGGSPVTYLGSPVGSPEFLSCSLGPTCP